MKRFFSLLLVLLLTVTLAACNLGNEIPDDILDCIENPDDPACDPTPLLCEDNEELINGECVIVSCPTGEVLQDGECIDEADLECPVGQEAVEGACQPIVCEIGTELNGNDCIAIQCPIGQELDGNDCVAIECEEGETLVGNNCIIVDDRTPEEIVADLIIDNWDGGTEHIDTFLNTLDYSSGMELETEFNLEVVDEGVTHFINYMIVDTYVYGDYTIIKRDIAFNFDNEFELEFEVILEEVDTGVRVYYNTDFIRALILENDTEGDVQAVLDTLGADGQWFMFKFDDSLANVVEFEVLKEMIQLAIYREFGEMVFYDLHDDLEMELMVDLDMYGINVGDFFGHIFADEYADAQMMLENADYEGLALALDMQWLVPEIVDGLTMDQVWLEATYPVLDVTAYITTLNTMGTKYWLENLTEPEIEALLYAYVDYPIPEMYEAYNDGTLDHWIIMEVLNEIEMDLMDIPGLDVNALMMAFDNLDYDMFYQEMPDLSGLGQAIYDGQMAFDAYIVDLALTSPETASILAPWSGYVLYLEDYMYIVDDIEYGFNELIVFETYFDPAYYFDNNMLAFEIEKTDDFEILTTLIVDGSEFDTMFEDFMEDLYWYLDGFESTDLPYVQYLNCPVGEVCDDFPEYAEMLANLAQLGDLEYTILFDPSDPTEAEFKFQAADLINSVMVMNGEMASVLDASITVTVREEDTLMVPTDITDVNMVAEEFAKFSLSIQAYDILQQVSEYYMMNPGEIPAVFLQTMTLQELVDMGIIDEPSYAYDWELSNVVFGAVDLANPLDMPDFGVNLVWLDGTDVFDDEVGFEELMMVFGPGMGAPDRADYLMYVDLVDEANFNMTKLLLVYLWEGNSPEEMPMP